MYTKQDIVNDYLTLCDSMEKDHLSRTEYREYGNYKTSLIEKMFGSWSNFIKEATNITTFSRNRNEKIVNVAFNTKTIVVTSVVDGQSINYDFLDVLKNYCKYNKADLYILWTKSPKNTSFSKSDYALLEDYLVTDLNLDADSSCLIKDLNISSSSKNPLTNLEKLTKYNTIIVASPKQYMKILPYDVDNNSYRVAWSTGTLSKINTNESVNDLLNSEYNTFGAIKLEFNKDLGKYITTNLVYDEDTKSITDLNKNYTKKSVKESTADCVILGDLHLPEENSYYIKKSIDLINVCLPSAIMIHDWCSFNSINHHVSHRYLTKVMQETDENKTLEIELKESVKRLQSIIEQCYEYSTFYLVHSNHDEFLMKWLNEGEFVKDKANAVIGCELFAKIAKGYHPFKDIITPSNRLCYLTNEDNLIINGIEVGNHGHEGIAGARASTKSYSKLYRKSVTGHTHSPQIFENHYVVGTNSNLKLPYTSKFTNWACCNAVIHKNGNVQLVFVD